MELAGVRRKEDYATPDGMASRPGNPYLDWNPPLTQGLYAPCSTVVQECHRRGRRAAADRGRNGLCPVRTRHPTHLRRTPRHHLDPHRLRIDRRGGPHCPHSWLSRVPCQGHVRTGLGRRLLVWPAERPESPGRRPGVFGRGAGPHHPPRGAPRWAERLVHVLGDVRSADRCRRREDHRLYPERPANRGIAASLRAGTAGPLGDGSRRVPPCRRVGLGDRLDHRRRLLSLGRRTACPRGLPGPNLLPRMPQPRAAGLPR